MKLGRHDPETFVQKSDVAIFDLGPSSRIIEVNVQTNQTKEMLTSITLELGPKSKIATSLFCTNVSGSCLPNFKAQLLAVFTANEGMCQKMRCEILTKRLLFRKFVNLQYFSNGWE